MQGKHFVIWAIFLVARAAGAQDFAADLSGASTPDSNVNQSTQANNGSLSGKIRKELSCAVRRTGGIQQLPRALAVGESFEKAWGLLEKKGIKPPSAAERRHFYAQVLHESGNFKWMSELGDGRPNYHGGAKFKGRGPLQVTHCYNYAAFTRFVKSLNGPGRVRFPVPTRKDGDACPPIDIANEELMKDPESAMGKSAKSVYLGSLAAIWWWENAKLRNPEFRASVQGGIEKVYRVSRTVNGGTNGLNDRINKFTVIRGCMND